MTNPQLAKLLDVMRSEPVYQRATPAQQAAMEKIIQHAAQGGQDQLIATSFGVFVANAIAEYYKVERPMVQDVLNAFFNTFKSAIIMETLMQVFPDPNTANEAAVDLGSEVEDIYRQQVQIFNNLAGAMIDDRIARNAKEPK